MLIDRPQEFPPSPAIAGRLLEQEQLLPLLICGVAGVAGYHGFFHLKKKYPGQVFGQRGVKTFRLTDPAIFGCDCDDLEGLKKIFETIRPKSVWNCGGSCALKACELDPAMANRINVTGVRNLVDMANQFDARLLHFSIDLVYSGDGIGDYVESDPVDPVTVYGKTMVDAEQLIQNDASTAAILRISLPMGVSFNGHAGAIDWIQYRFANSRPATLYFDEIRTPTYVECLTEVAEEVLSRQDISGIFHAGGPRKLSLYQIAQIVNSVGNYDPSLLQGCPRLDAGPIPPRAGNVTMNSGKLISALGRNPFVPWPLLEKQIPSDRKSHWNRDPNSGHQRLRETLYRRPVQG